MWPLLTSITFARKCSTTNSALNLKLQVYTCHGDNTYKVVQSISLTNLNITMVNGFETVNLSRHKSRKWAIFRTCYGNRTSPLNLMYVDVKDSSLNLITARKFVNLSQGGPTPYAETEDTQLVPFLRYNLLPIGVKALGLCLPAYEGLNQDNSTRYADDETKLDNIAEVQSVHEDYVYVIVRYKNFQFVLLKPYETAFIKICDDICRITGIDKTELKLYLSTSWPLQKAWYGLILMQKETNTLILT